MSNQEVEFDVRYIFGKIPFNLQLTQFTWLLMVGFLLSNRGVLRGNSSLFSVLSLPSEICGTVRCRRDRCWPSDVCSSGAGVRQGFCLCNKTETSPLPNMRDMGSASTELFFQDALRCKCYLPSSYRQWDPKVPATLVATGVESDEPSFMYDPVLSLCTRIQEPASGK